MSQLSPLVRHPSAAAASMDLPHPLPPAVHAPHSVRLRRVRLAALIYAVCVPLMILAYALGLVGFSAAMGTIAGQRVAAETEA